MLTISNGMGLEVLDNFVIGFEIGLGSKILNKFEYG